MKDGECDEMPVEQVGAWLFRVARNRIVDLFRSKRPVVLGTTPH
jgi:DNA-directed RNA polymerase specialized sigma24 family protein